MACMPCFRPSPRGAVGAVLRDPHVRCMRPCGVLATGLGYRAQRCRREVEGLDTNHFRRARGVALIACGVECEHRSASSREQLVVGRSEEVSSLRLPQHPHLQARQVVRARQVMHAWTHMHKSPPSTWRNTLIRAHRMSRASTRRRLSALAHCVQGRRRPLTHAYLRPKG
jgi:hypothetical protein